MHSSMRSGMVITLRNVVSSVVLTAVSRSPSNISANVSESEADGIAVTIYAVIATERSSPGKSLKSAKPTANAASGDTTSLMRQVTYTLTSVKSEANFTSARRIPRIIIDSAYRARHGNDYVNGDITLEKEQRQRDYQSGGRRV